MSAAAIGISIGVIGCARAPVQQSAADDGATTASNKADDSAEATENRPPLKLPEPKGAKRLSPKYDVWVDPERRAVIVDGEISLREGMLEMFACTRNTKEHESIVSANTRANLVHAGLLALGAEPGTPVKFVPKYEPPTGTEVEVLVEWIDERGKQRSARAQDWIKDIQTGKAMVHPFVFAGSGFWTDEETGKKYYKAEGGDFICVSNFSTAMLDIPIESSQANVELGFEAFTERIPPLAAPVRLVLKPKVKVTEMAKAAGSNAESRPSDRESPEPQSGDH